MSFSHVFITRPAAEAAELASLLAPLGLDAVLQPAFEYVAQDASADDPDAWAELEAAGHGDLVVFTSPRAVDHGLSQLPRTVLERVRLAAIGPATAKALAAAGLRVGIVPASGYTSEALLDTLRDEAAPGEADPGRAFIVAAPGGRTALLEGLERFGWRAAMIMAYRSEPAPLDRTALAALDRAHGVLSVWTSGNAMQSLSQRLPPATWFRLCQGQWLVTSERLRRLARAYGPTEIDLAGGPGNDALAAAIRNLVRGRGGAGA